MNPVILNMLQNLLHRINANGKSYQIKEIYRIYPDSDEQEFLRLKQHRGYDALIKSDEFYFLCNEIVDATFIEISNTTENEIADKSVNENINEINEPIKDLNNNNNT